MVNKKDNLKNRIYYGLISGVIYGVVLLVIDIYREKEIEWGSLLIKALVFSIIMALIFGFKQSKKK